MKGKKVIIALSAIVLIVAVLSFRGNPTCPSCDDGNPCTANYCSQETGFNCESRVLDGLQPGCNGVGEGCKSQYCFQGECLTDLSMDCCGNGICERGEDEIKCSQDCLGVCPESCDDGNPCTRDLCGISTDYNCVQEIVYSPECNTSCPIDCDDDDICTEDFCSSATNFDCFHSPIRPCCGDHICEEYETLMCVKDCAIRGESLKRTDRFRRENENEWIYRFSKNIIFQTLTENVTFHVSCSKEFLNGSSGYFLPFITESRRMGRFDEKTSEADFNGYIECVDGLCNINQLYSKEPKRGTRILNASRGSRGRISYYFVFKEPFFYDVGVDGNLPKENVEIKCNLSITSQSPPQEMLESFSLQFTPSCGDGIHNQGEDAVDCGGPCPKCECWIDSDCGFQGFVGSRYCYDPFEEVARDYRYVTCEKPEYAKPYCNITLQMRLSGVSPCPETGFY